MINAIAFRTNQEVTAPIGAGRIKAIVQGPYHKGGYLVRVAVSGSATDAHCVTPKAAKSSLWAFPADELKSV